MQAEEQFLLLCLAAAVQYKYKQSLFLLMCPKTALVLTK